MWDSARRETTALIDIAMWDCAMWDCAIPDSAMWDSAMWETTTTRQAKAFYRLSNVGNDNTYTSYQSLLSRSQASLYLCMYVYVYK